MFALIIAIIAIALTVYLAVSTLFYGGDGLSNGSARAIASTFINQGQQINGAHVLYKNDNAGASLTQVNETAALGTSAVSTELTKLVTQKYLSSVPTPPKGNAYRISDNLSITVTEATGVTAKAIYDTSAAIPAAVCTIISDQAANSTGTFGCVTGATANTVWYRM
jgi:hypothetical protein